MKFLSVIFLCVLALTYAKDCPSKRINSKLICYYSKLSDIDSCYCTHVILPANTDFNAIQGLRQKLSGVKILLTVNEFNQVEYLLEVSRAFSPHDTNCCCFITSTVNNVNSRCITCHM